MPFKDPKEKCRWRVANRERQREHQRRHFKKRLAERMLDPEFRAKALHRLLMQTDSSYASTVLAARRAEKQRKDRESHIPKPRKASPYPAPWTWEVCGGITNRYRAKSPSGWNRVAVNICRARRFMAAKPCHEKSIRKPPSDWASAVTAICNYFCKLRVRAKDMTLEERWAAKANRVVAGLRNRPVKEHSNGNSQP